jgi:putative flippase GtrA
MAIATAFAGAIGYAAGLVLHYALSVRFVFDAAATAKASAQLVGEFALSGLVGLGITTLVIWLATDVAGASALVAKIPAAAASFMGLFALRRMVVLARGSAGVWRCVAGGLPSCDPASAVVGAATPPCVRDRRASSNWPAPNRA